MSDLDDFKATYFDECSELLVELEEQFAQIDAGDRAPERLNAVFRAIHSIKGGAGAFGFSALVGFAHAYETLLDHVREGRIDLAHDTVALCLKANDIVADFIEAARNGTTLAADYGVAERQRFDLLCSATGAPVAGAAAASDGTTPAGTPEDDSFEEFDIDFVPVMVKLDHAEDEEAGSDSFERPPLEAAAGHWEIHFAPHRELYARANDPLLLFRELASIGEVRMRPVLDAIPALVDFEPFGVYCRWEITLVSPLATRERIAEVFEFVEGNCDLAIVELAAPAGEGAAAFPDTGDLFPATFGAEAVEGPSLADLAEEIRASAAAPRPGPSAMEQAEAPTEPPPEAPTGTAPADAPAMAPAKAVHADPVPASDHDGDRRNGVQSIRVDLDKIDRVVNMVGELVITQSMLTQQMDETLRVRYQELVRGLEVLAQTTRGLQDSVMAIRAQPVKSVFSRMPRLVRELAAKTGKKIKLETIGENTEIDKTVIEQLSDPLTHMIRNSSDHGIESPQVRRALGKPETGTVKLSAEQAGGNILIIVEDDGAGINREKVLQVARNKGVIGPDTQLTDEQIDQLIFAPGFSTADSVSDISGRGVGMDVVLSNIKKIGGSVHVRSWPGRGTRMTLRLPLTLAVLDVMLVKVGTSPYVIPLSSIVETMQCARADFGHAPSGARVLRVRGEYVQVIDLAQRFEMPAGVPFDQRFVVLCEAEGSVKVALVVDDIIGQQQVVIKSLEENFERIDGIAGGTILGDGNVALIVDVQGLKSTSVTHRNAA